MDIFNYIYGYIYIYTWSFNVFYIQKTLYDPNFRSMKTNHKIPKITIEHLQTTSNQHRYCTVLFKVMRTTRYAQYPAMFSIHL